MRPTFSPTLSPTLSPFNFPKPTSQPNTNPNQSPTFYPTLGPTLFPSLSPLKSPTTHPTQSLTLSPSDSPMISPTYTPTVSELKANDLFSLAFQSTSQISSCFLLCNSFNPLNAYPSLRSILQNALRHLIREYAYHLAMLSSLFSTKTMIPIHLIYMMVWCSLCFTAVLNLHNLDTQFPYPTKPLWPAVLRQSHHVRQHEMYLHTI
jgi:hypothetical protein